MHHNYYFLKHLSQVLSTRISGFEIVEVFSQSKDELIISMLKNQDEFHIKATLESKISMLSFPERFARARRNSIDLFPDVIGMKIKQVTQFENERSFSLELENGLQLVFKMHGRRSNIILFNGNQVKTLFNNQMKNDLDLDLSTINRSLDQSFQFFQNHGIENTFPTFDKKIKAELIFRGFQNNSQKEDWDLIEGMLHDLEPPFYIYEDQEGLPYLSLFKQKDNLLLESADPLKLCNELFYKFTKSYTLNHQKNGAINNLQTRIGKANNYISKTQNKLEGLEANNRNEEIANIIMANLHAIPANKKIVSLFDFYQNKQVEVKLNPNYTPQRNAENFYRKAKNKKIEIDKLAENILSKQKEVDKLVALQKTIASIEDLKELRKITKTGKTDKAEKSQETFPFKKFEIDGWSVLVGKNAKSNDILTLHYATKNDYWLHAKDVSGSHLVIKSIPGKSLPGHVLEKSAQIAAYFSKRKTDSLCPVIHTLKKYVRKPKGAAPGQVIVDKEEVVLVEPMSPENVLSSN